MPCRAFFVLGSCFHDVPVDGEFIRLWVTSKFYVNVSDKWIGTRLSVVTLTGLAHLVG
jgi:hypothetical protein